MPLEAVLGWILGNLEVRHGSGHCDHLFAGHGLPDQVAQGVIDRLAFGLEVKSHHHTLYQRIVDVDIGARHVEKDTPMWCMRNVLQSVE
jgi:hypothetical protein